MIFKAIVLAVGVLLFCLFIRFTVKFFNILHVSSTSAPNGLIYTPTKNPGDPPIPLAFKRKRPKDPRTRSDYHPKAGIYLIDQLLAGQTGSVRTELRAFIESVRAQLRLYTNDEVRTLRQGKFQNIWQKFLAEEGVLYLRNRGRIPPNAGFELLDQEYPCEYTPGPHSFTIEKSRLTGVRPSGAPQSILHIILDKPTGKEGTYTHLSSPTLDPGNDTTRALMKKCLTSSSCFAFDHFSRRVITSRPRRFTVRNICGEWNHVHDKLHSEYRKLGGKVALIFGDQAFKAYLTVVEKENSVALESLTKNRRCGYTVLIERKKSDSEILRIVVNCYHPSYIRIKQKEIKWAICLDNGINLATSIAGLGDLIQTNYFTDNRTRLNKKSVGRKRRCPRNHRPIFFKSKK